MKYCCRASNRNSRPRSTSAKGIDRSVGLCFTVYSQYFFRITSWRSFCELLYVERLCETSISNFVDEHFADEGRSLLIFCLAVQLLFKIVIKSLANIFHLALHELTMRLNITLLIFLFIFDMIHMYLAISIFVSQCLERIRSECLVEDNQEEGATLWRLFDSLGAFH